MKSTASAVMIAIAGLSTTTYAPHSAAQTSDPDLNLAADSPFRDPDIIYLEADTLVTVSYTHLTLPTICGV